MFISISSSQTLGLLIRASRKRQKIRMDDLAGSAGVGPVFVREVERGKETVQLGRVLKLLAELGIELKANVPEDVVAAFAELRLTGVKPLKPHRPARKATLAGALRAVSSPTEELKCEGHPESVSMSAD